MFDEYEEVQSPVQRFIARQVDENGKPLAKVKTGSSWLFSNGARIDGDPTGRQTFMTLREPPFGEEDTLRFELEYVTTAMEKERDDFDTYRSTVLQQADHHVMYPNCDLPPQEAADILTAGLARIRVLESRYSELTKKLVELPGSAEYIEIERRRQAAQERQQRFDDMDAYKTRIRAIQRVNLG